MPLHMLPTAETAEPSTGSVLDTFIHEDLPTFALCSGTMAAIWLACAAITFAGAFTGAVVVAAIRTMAQSCANYLRRWDAEHDQPITADTADGDQATTIDLEPYRASREYDQSEDADDRFRGDDPA